MHVYILKDTEKNTYHVLAACFWGETQAGFDLETFIYGFDALEECLKAINEKIDVQINGQIQKIEMYYGFMGLAKRSERKFYKE